MFMSELAFDAGVDWMGWSTTNKQASHLIGGKLGSEAHNGTTSVRCSGWESVSGLGIPGAWHLLPFSISYLHFPPSLPSLSFLFSLSILEYLSIYLSISVGQVSVFSLSFAGHDKRKGQAGEDGVSGKYLDLLVVVQFSFCLHFSPCLFLGFLPPPIATRPAAPPPLLLLSLPSDGWLC